jgi:hypothetical protein
MISEFSIESSGDRISNQWYGRAEVFWGGRLDDKAVTNQQDGSKFGRHCVILILSKRLLMIC